MGELLIDFVLPEGKELFTNPSDTDKGFRYKGEERNNHNSPTLIELSK